MKTISFLVLFHCFSLHCISQSLEGEWKGYFNTDLDIPIDITSPIKLYFRLNKDSSYTVYSYSRGRDHKVNDTTVVCKVSYKKTSENSLYLEETEVIKPVNTAPACFQKMYLTIKREKASTILEGTWETGKECASNGKIKFIKKD